jgi:nicotinate-nucleotide adenylyltransferase
VKQNIYENRLYFGTFNPIHVGHLIIANHMAENADLDQVWLVVTHNPLKKSTLMTTIGYKWCILLPRIFKIATL